MSWCALLPSEGGALTGTRRTANPPSSPRRRGPRAFISQHLRPEIVPIGIAFFDQPQFPGAIPLLQPLFSQDGMFHVAVEFVEDEAMHLVAFGETRGVLQVLPDAPHQVAGDADVKRPVPPACEDVHAGQLVVHPTSLMREPWVPAFAGMTSWPETRDFVTRDSHPSPPRRRGPRAFRSRPTLPNGGESSIHATGLPSQPALRRIIGQK
ncbi:MAG: hypothetical protein K0S48_3813 [Ramlibacter sp.]|nr:hypothetical protein [Ramlibacter sp.]